MSLGSVFVRAGEKLVSGLSSYGSGVQPSGWSDVDALGSAGIGAGDVGVQHSAVAPVEYFDRPSRYQYRLRAINESEGLGFDVAGSGKGGGSGAELIPSYWELRGGVARDVLRGLGDVYGALNSWAYGQLQYPVVNVGSLGLGSGFGGGLREAIGGAWRSLPKAVQYSLPHALITTGSLVASGLLWNERYNRGLEAADERTEKYIDASDRRFYESQEAAERRYQQTQDAIAGQNLISNELRAASLDLSYSRFAYQRWKDSTKGQGAELLGYGGGVNSEFGFGTYGLGYGDYSPRTYKSRWRRKKRRSKKRFWSWY